MATAAPVLKTPRELYRTALYDALEEKRQKIHAGEYEGLEYVPWDDVRMLVNAPFPPPSDHGAEVATPARVVVFAVCPRCGQSAPVGLEVSPELRVDSSGGHLHIKGKSKPVYHTCGQLRVELVDGQESFELEDIVGVAEGAIAAAEDLDAEEAGEAESGAGVVESGAGVVDLSGLGKLAPPEDFNDARDEDARPDDGMPGLTCDWPRCRLSLGHSGPHKMPPGRPPKLPTDDAAAEDAAAEGDTAS